MKKTLLKFLPVASLSLAIWGLAAYAAPPQLPHMIYGKVTVNGEPADLSTVITAAVNGVERGRFTTNRVGVYGGPDVFDQKFLIQGDDLTPDSVIRFNVLNTQAPETVSFSSGVITNLDLTFTGVVFAPTPTPQPPFVAGGGVAGTAPTTPTPLATPTPPVPPEVAGAAIFVFTKNLGIGSTGNDVLELQKRLTAEGVYAGPQTGYFGSLTETAVRSYQAKKGISTTGFLGPLTRTALNKLVAGESIVNRQALINSIGETLKQIADKIKLLMEELKKLLEATPTPTATPTQTPTPTPTPMPGGGGGY